MGTVLRASYPPKWVACAVLSRSTVFRTVARRRPSPQTTVWLPLNHCLGQLFSKSRTKRPICVHRGPLEIRHLTCFGSWRSPATCRHPAQAAPPLMEPITRPIRKDNRQNLTPPLRRKDTPTGCSNPRSTGAVCRHGGLSDPPLLAGGLLCSGPPAPWHQLQVVQAVVHSHRIQMHHLEARSDAPSVPLPGDRQTAL